jgi:xylulokinase
MGVNVYSIMNLELEKAPSGSQNVIFLPYMREGGAPYHNPKARGAFIGLNLTCRKEHLLRAVLEGVALNFKIIIENFERVNLNIREFRAIGGGALNRLWVQMFADILDRPIVCPQMSQEANAFGAAIAGGIGIQMFRDFTVMESLSQATYECTPLRENSERYERLYPVFKCAYEQLVPVFDQLNLVDDGLP